MAVAQKTPSRDITAALDELKQFLISFIVDQTGYPADVVSLDADLEADLGIDSIKKAQLFGELGEHFKIAPPTGNVTLDDFPTLGNVYDFIAESYKTNLAAAGTASPSGAQSSPTHRATPDAVASTNITPQAQSLHTENGSNGAASDDSRRSLETFQIDFSVEQTGYPPESVDIDADLEADLGIDSIKKAQLFGELGEHFRIAAPMGNITLDDFPTLRHVLDFIHGASSPSGDRAGAPQIAAAANVAAASQASSAPQVVATPQSAPAPAASVAASPPNGKPAIGAEHLQEFLINFVVEQTGYPQEQVDLDADFEADLGIDSIKKAQMFGEIGEHFPIAAPSGNITLDDFPTLRHVLAYMIQNIGTESHVVQNGVNGHAHEHDRQPPVDFPTHTPTNGPANGKASTLASSPALAGNSNRSSRSDRAGACRVGFVDRHGGE